MIKLGNIFYEAKIKFSPKYPKAPLFSHTKSIMYVLSSYEHEAVGLSVCAKNTIFSGYTHA